MSDNFENLDPNNINDRNETKEEEEEEKEEEEEEEEEEKEEEEEEEEEEEQEPEEEEENEEGEDDEENIDSNIASLKKSHRNTKKQNSMKKSKKYYLAPGDKITGGQVSLSKDITNQIMSNDNNINLVSSKDMKKSHKKIKYKLKTTKGKDKSNDSLSNLLLNDNNNNNTNNNNNNNTNNYNNNYNNNTNNNPNNNKNNIDKLKIRRVSINKNKNDTNHILPQNNNKIFSSSNNDKLVSPNQTIYANNINNNSPDDNYNNDDVSKPPTINFNNDSNINSKNFSIFNDNNINSKNLVGMKDRITYLEQQNKNLEDLNNFYFDLINNPDNSNSKLDFSNLQKKEEKNTQKFQQKDFSPEGSLASNLSNQNPIKSYENEDSFHNSSSINNINSNLSLDDKIKEFFKNEQNLSDFKLKQQIENLNVDISNKITKINNIKQSSKTIEPELKGLAKQGKTCLGFVGNSNNKLSRRAGGLSSPNIMDDECNYMGSTSNKNIENFNNKPRIISDRKDMNLRKIENDNTKNINKSFMIGGKNKYEDNSIFKQTASFYMNNGNSNNNSISNSRDMGYKVKYGNNDGGMGNIINDICKGINENDFVVNEQKNLDYPKRRYGGKI